MKKILLSIFALSIGTTLFAQEETAIKANIEKVTVFLQGAQITQSGTANLNKGKHLLKLSGLSPFIQNNSISVKTSENITLINVLSQINYIQAANAPRRLLQIDDSLQLLQDQFDLGVANAQVYEEEKSMILANKSIKGQEALDVADLQDASKYFREHLRELADKIQEDKIHVRGIKKNIDRLHSEKNTLNHTQTKETGEIIMEVYAAQSGNMDFEVTYYTGGATWTPTYDVRAKDINSPINLNYKANVQQSTGVDWKEVQLTLSTGNPSVSGQAPDIYKWTIDNRLPEHKRKFKNELRRADAAAPAYDTEGLSEMSVAKSLSFNYNASVAQEATTTHQYLITTPYTIVSDNKSHKIDVAQHTVAASYKYLAVPKSDPTAFLVAEITGWEKLNLLPGEASIFFEDAFVGTSLIDPSSASDTMNVSLGRDKSILISRTKSTELSKKAIIGSDKTTEITWEIKVRNTKQKAITIVVKDQIPVSINRDIEVSNDIKDGQLDAESGVVKWESTINPADEKIIRFGYKVKYPKKFVVVLE